MLVVRLLSAIAFVTVASSARAAPSLAPPKTGEPITESAGLAYGQWQDSVAIEVPPAPNSSQPAITVIASNGTVDGDLGSRWTLQASSEITRHSTSGGAPNFTIGAGGWPEDLYRLDGMDLVSVASPAPAHFEPETWDGSTLTYASATNTWTRKRSGWTWTYGTAAGTGVNATRTIVDTATITLPNPGLFTTCATMLCKTSTWHLSKVVDPFGNIAIYNYKKGTTVSPYPNHTHLLDTITYAGNTIEFIYGARKVTKFAVQAGSPTALADRLKEIKAKVGTTQFSRYVFQYEDETIDSRLGTLTDCDGAAPVPPATIKQDLLRKIVRVGTTSGTQHTLRCMRWRHETTTWQDDAAAKILTVVDAPTPHTDLLEESVIPIATTFNDDGITDLLVVGVRPGSVNVRVYIATPNLDRAFASSTVGGGEPHDDAVLWETEIAARLTAGLFDNRRGWAVVDVDNNLTPEILYEDANGDVTMRRFNGSGFSSVVTGLDGCDLRHASFADIDGDLRPDAVIRAHGDDSHGCAAVTTTKWIRNTGTNGYFVSAVARTLKVPLELATPPSAWTTIMNGVCSAAGTLRSGPYDINPSWELTEEGYVADHVRITDVNDDGIADAVISLYGCWTTTGDIPAGGDNDADWEPVTGSLYSEVWLGDGNGNFLATGRSAGLPLTFDLEDAGSSAIVTNRLVSGQFAPVDVDRNGVSEVLTTQPTSEGGQGRISTYANLALGWNLASDVWASNGVTTPALYYLSPACNCYLRIGTEAMGDFDGDGMLDIVRIATDDFTNAASSTPCAANTWCATLHLNLRTGSEGQLLSVDGPWGGRTQLTWGFSAHEPHDNPRLRSNLEVIEEVDGADGVVGMTYSGAFTYGTRPTPFAQVERQNARGGVDQFGYITAPWAAGKRTHAARFRTDGTLEREEVDVHGYIWNGAYLFSYNKPYFNPLVRECVYDVGNGAFNKVQSYDVGDLIARCYEFTGGVPNPNGFENGPGMVVVSKANIPLALGQTEGMLMQSNPAQSQGVYQAAFGNAAANGMVLTMGTISDIDAWDYSLEGHAMLLTSFYAFANLPTELLNKVPDVRSIENNYTYPVEALPTPLLELIKDHFWNLTARKHDSTFDYRDTSTLDDDLEHAYTYGQPVTSGLWYRLTKHDTRDRFGALKTSERHNLFHAVAKYTPLDLVTCGTNGTTCVTSTLTYDGAGNLTGHTFPDGASEAWTAGACGLAADHTDAVGRKRTNTITTCRITRSDFEGGSQTWSFDGIGRVTQTVITPGGGAPATTFDTYYDDALQYRVDQTYLEPRVGTKRSDNQLTLTYLDDFGRETRLTECKAGGPTTGQSGVLARANCLANTSRTKRLDVYGADGLLKITTEPFLPGELPVTHAIAHDGYGRPIVELDPAHQTGGPTWVTTTYNRSAKWTERIDPLGNKHRATFTTMRVDHTTNGVSRGGQTFDVMSRPVDTIASDGLVERRTYGVLGRLGSIQRIGTSPCVDAGSVVNCTWFHDYISYDSSGRLLSERTPDGVLRSYTYDGLGRRTTKRVAGTLLENVSYVRASPSSPPKMIASDENGVVATTTLDGFDRPVTRELLDTIHAVSYGVNGQAATVDDLQGRRTTITYDTFDRVVTLDAPGTPTTSLVYSGNDRLLSTTDADNVTITREYTFAGDLYRSIRAGTWTEVTRTYDALGQSFDVTENGVRRIYDWDSLGRLEAVDVGVSAGSPEQRIAYAYDAGDRLLSQTITPIVGTPSTATLAYDAWGQLATVTDGNAQAWSVDRDVVGRARFRHTPSGNTSETVYDARGRITAEQRRGIWRYASYAASQTWSTTPNLARIRHWDGGDPVDAGGSPLVFADTFVDGLGREVAAIHRDGTVHASTWDGLDLTQETWTSSNTVLAIVDRVMDSAGFLKEETGPYAPADLVAKRDSRSYLYSNAGRVVQTTAPEQVTSYTYTGGLQSTEAWDDQVRTLLRANTAATWTTGERLSGGGSLRETTYARDRLGRITSQTTTAPALPTVTTTHTRFTAFGKPTLEKRLVAGVTEATTSWTYDNAGHPTQRIVTPSTGNQQITDWGWSPDGLLELVTTPQGLDIGYEYDANNLLSRVFDATTNQSYGVISARNGRGQVTSVEQPLAATQRTYVYDESTRMVARTSGPIGGAATTSWSATYDAFDRIVRESTTEGIVANVNTFAYDGHGRLVEEQRGALGDRRRYSWSRGGNLLATEVAPNGGAYTTETKSTYVGQKLASVDGVNLSYNAWQATTLDQHGNAFTYAADGEIQQITGPAATPVTILRDADGLPIAHLEGGIDPRQIAWSLDEAGLPLEVHQSDGVDRTYAAGEGMLLGTLQNAVFTSGELDKSGNFARAGADLLGRTTAWGAGAEIPSGTDERFVFGGLELVKGAVNIHLARHRSYDTETGRFESPDPVGLRGGWNRFLYADGDPVQRIDPKGLTACLAPLASPPNIYAPPIQAQTAMFQDVYGNQYEEDPNMQTDTGPAKLSIINIDIDTTSLDPKCDPGLGTCPDKAPPMAVGNQNKKNDEDAGEKIRDKGASKRERFEQRMDKKWNRYLERAKSKWIRKFDKSLRQEFRDRWMGSDIGFLDAFHERFDGYADAWRDVPANTEWAPWHPGPRDRNDVEFVNEARQPEPTIVTVIPECPIQDPPPAPPPQIIVQRVEVPVEVIREVIKIVEVPVPAPAPVPVPEPQPSKPKIEFVPPSITFADCKMSASGFSCTLKVPVAVGVAKVEAAITIGYDWKTGDATVSIGGEACVGGNLVCVKDAKIKISAPPDFRPGGMNGLPEEEPNPFDEPLIPIDPDAPPGPWQIVFPPGAFDTPPEEESP